MTAAVELEKKRAAYVVIVEAVEAIRSEEPALFKEAMLAMHDYNLTGAVDLEALSPAARVFFNSFRKGMDFYAQKYEAKVKRNRENGKKNRGKKDAL